MLVLNLHVYHIFYHTHARLTKMFVDHMPLIQLEYEIPSAKEEWTNLLSINPGEIPKAILRKLLPFVLKGIAQGVLLNCNC